MAAVRMGTTATVTLIATTECTVYVLLYLILAEVVVACNRGRSNLLRRVLRSRLQNAKEIMLDTLRTCTHVRSEIAQKFRRQDPPWLEMCFGVSVYDLHASVFHLQSIEIESQI